MKPLLLFFLLLGFWSCQPSDVFTYRQDFEQTNWNRFHFIEFDVDIADPDQLYDLVIDFTHTSEYPSDHIAINFTIFFANAGLRSRDYTFRLQNTGQQWIGQPSGNGYMVPLPVLSGMQFPEAGKHRIRIENKMTKYDLPGVVSVVFRMRKAA